MEGDSAVRNTVEAKAPSSVQKRAEMRRRKLLMTSDQRMSRILNYNQQPELSESQHATEPRFHLDLDRTEPLPFSSKHGTLFLSEPQSQGGVGEPLEEEGGEQQCGLRSQQRGPTASEEPSHSPRIGINSYLSRFDDAMKLRSQLAHEKVSQDSKGGEEEEELDCFRLVRLLGSMVLAVCVRLFVCHFLSIFAPFLTLELAYLGLYKYFPKVERKMKTTVLSAALLLSGIPAEVISRSAETYRNMGDVFSDLCVYFFTFISCHELLLFFSSASE